MGLEAHRRGKGITGKEMENSNSNRALRTVSTTGNVLKNCRKVNSKSGASRMLRQIT